MKKTIVLFILFGILPLLVLVSCKSSERPASRVANTPNPTERSVVATAQALLIQTEQINTRLPTSPPTVTFTSTPQISLTGTSLVFRENLTAVFIDHKAGIKLTIPSGWLPVRPNEDEYYKAFTNDVVINDPDIYKRLNQIQTHDTNFFRLDAIDIRSGHVVNGLISDISVIFQENDFRTLEEWSKAERGQVSPYTGYKFLSSKYQETTDGTRVLVIEKSWDYQGGTLYYQSVFFSIPTGTLVLDFQTNSDFKDTVLPDFEQVVNSLTLLETQ